MKANGKTKKEKKENERCDRDMKRLVKIYCDFRCRCESSDDNKRPYCVIVGVCGRLPGCR